MKRRMVAILLALALVLGGGAVLAKNTDVIKHLKNTAGEQTAALSTESDEGSVNIDAIDDLELTQEELEDYYADVTGYVAFDTEQDGLKLVKLVLQAQLDDADWEELDAQEFDPAEESSTLTDRDDADGYSFIFEDLLLTDAEGTYNVEVIATFEDAEEQETTVSGTTSFEVTLEDAEDEDDNDENDSISENDNGGNSNPAAPAVANKILKKAGIKNNDKVNGNYIANLNHVIKGKGLKKKDLSEEEIWNLLKDECKAPLGEYDSNGGGDTEGDLTLDDDAITLVADGNSETVEGTLDSDYDIVSVGYLFTDGNADDIEVQITKSTSTFEAEITAGEDAGGEYVIKFKVKDDNNDWYYATLEITVE